MEKYKLYLNQIFRRMRLNWDAYLFLLPFALIYLLFTLTPVLTSFYYSFTYFNILQVPQFVGFQNYINLFLTDDIFITAVKNTFFIAFVTGPLGYLASVLLAWFISELRPIFRAVMVVVFYAPSLSGAAFMIWTLLFNGDTYGYINATMMNLGVFHEPIQWLTDPKYMMTVVVIVQLWMSLGAGFLSFVAGFQTMDRSLYEAGYIDGIKNRWQELWFITLPSLKPQMMFGAVMSITAAFSVGDITSALCGSPSTDYAVHTILNHLEDYGTIRFELGYACAIATVLFVTMLLLNHFIQKMLSKVGR